MRILASRLAPLIRDSPAEKIALLLAVGLMLGIFPVFSCPTILCGLASLVLWVNFPALLMVNQLSWPLQIFMLLPFARLGSRIVGPSSGFATSLAGRLGAAALEATVGWACVCIPLGIVVYIALTCLLRQNGNHWLGLPMQDAVDGGAVFIAHARLADVLSVVQDYDRHHIFYKPDVENAKIESRQVEEFLV